MPQESNSCPAQKDSKASSFYTMEALRNHLRTSLDLDAMALASLSLLLLGSGGLLMQAHRNLGKQNKRQLYFYKT
jgi:hypothetical protein